MRTLAGELPYTTDNQSAILLMYRAWLFILSIGIVLPLRWLPHVFSKPSKLAVPVATTMVMVTCGELLLNNPSITPAGPYCPGDLITITFTGTNLPDGENLDVFIGSTSSYNPFLGGGTQIGSIPIDYTCSSPCPTLLGLMANPCGNDVDNEYAVLSSGCGFNVDDLYFDLDPLNNTGAGNADPGSVSCPFGTPDPTLISLLQTGNCATLIIPAGPGDDIPGGANVIIFTDSGTPAEIPNLDDLCANGQPVYILQNSCTRTGVAISNNASSANPTRTYTIYTNGLCPDAISFGYDPGYNAQNSEFRLEDGTLIGSSGCDAPFDLINYPDIPNNLVSLNYTLPANICGSNTGDINFYISGMVDLTGPCADMLYTSPANGAITVACPAQIDPAGPYCADGAPDTLTASNMPGGTWSGPGITNSTVGIFDPSVAGPGSHIISYDVGCPGGASTATIVVYDAVTIDPGSVILDNDVPCLGGTGDAVFLGSYSGGSGNYYFEWDDADTPGNDVYPDDGNISITGLTEGNYYFIVYDDNGCADTLAFDIAVFMAPTISATIDPINCFGGTTGVGFGINITVSGGPGGNIYYDWNVDGGANEDFGGPPAVDDDAEDIYNLSAGTYYLTVTITDEFSYFCDYLDTFVITQPTQLTVTAPDVALPCFGNTTTPTATPSGGTPNYIYNWSHIGGSNNPPPWAPVGAGSYIVTVTDMNGCTASDVMTVTQPSAALMASATGETIPCNDGSGDINLTVSGGTTMYSYSWSPGGYVVEDPSGLNAGTYTVTVTDANGCTTTAQATIVLQDIIPPGITCPANITLACNAAVPAPDPSSVTATDACGAPLVTHGGDATSTVGCIETTTRTYIATDVNGNTASCTHTITRTVDPAPPMITCPANVTLGCNASVPGADINSVTASDGCGNVVVTHVGDNTSTVGCVETTTRTYQATDDCGNTATCTQTITRTVDITPPAFSGIPGPSTIECTGTPSFVTPTVTDACGAPVVTFADVTTNGSCPNEFSVTRTWTATDGCGNTATASQTINVDDTTPPVISGIPGTSTIECSGTPVWGNPTATDNCSAPALTFVDATMAGSCPDAFTLTRTWTATDACGNTATGVQTINVDDTTPPVISGLPGASSIECSGTPTWVTPTVTDNCSTPIVVFADVTTNGSCPNEYTITRTWTATDDCGNTATATQVFNVDDTTPPTISGVPGPSSIECSATPVWGSPTASDNCATPTLTFVDATIAGSCPGSYTLTRTWTANDGCGNTATAVQTITVDDTTPPVISGLPGPSTIECSATPNWVTPTATDNCGTPTLTFVDATMAGSCPDAYTITRTWTADDGCGNTATASQVISVDDTTPPVISGLPGPSTIECSATPNFATPTATDNCATPALTFVDATMAGSCPDAYTITRTWTATDDCGNTATASQVINVNDTTPPVIGALPGPSTVECSGTPSWVTPTATDNCSTPSLTFADVTTNGSCPNEYTITRTWTATDDCGNTATASQVFTIDDTTPPVISGLPGPSTIECSGTPNFATPTATDNCSTPTLTFADVTTNGSCPNEYTITRTWTADDGCGNTATATQVINVDDTMPPTISGVPGPSSIECDATPVWGNPTATDNCATPTLTFVDATMAGSCPGSYTLTRTWTANDGCGNTATAVQTITVDDTTPPVISGLPGPSTIECSATPNWVTPTATDNCGTPTLTFVDVTMAGSCPDAYTITRTWTADDGCGNTATASQVITVDDTTPPVISGLPGPSTIECSATPNFATPTATDNCSTPALAFVDATMAGSCPDAYTITRTWTATDDCGNTATASQVINVDDTTPPVISGLPGPSTAECSGTPSWVTPTATDNCGTPALTFADVTTNGSCPNEFTITRTWTATDDCGNTATASQVFTIDDTTPPVISGLPGPSTIECSGTPNFATATATDNCSTPILTFADVTTNGSCPNEYTITRTWTADDGCGNTATATQVINVDDTTPPTISGVPGPSSIECDGTPVWGNPTATDNCATPTLTFVDATMAGSCPGSYTLTRTWTADDGCGNTATAVQTITVDDTTPPVISGLPGPSMIECSATPNWVTPTATDNCGTPTLTFVDATMAGSCPDAYTITRTWTADDGCGNTATASQVITVDDTTPPVISGLPGPTTIECSVTPNFATPTATDNCAAPALTFVDATMAGSCPDAYTITRTWTATDNCGNTATAEQVINVDDTTPPVISGLPGPSTAECSGTPSWVTPTATDNCGTPALTFADVTTNGSCPNEYTITRTWTATDDCGNTATAAQVFTIDDTTPPVISGLPGPSTIECSGTPNFATATATDNCSTPTLTFADVTTNGSCPNEYTITRTWTADDGCGNTATAIQVINVDDTMPPTISGVPGPSSIECDGTPVWGTPTATDNCSTPTLTFVDATVAGSCPGSYTLTRTWTADDGCGNTATAVQTINVDDTTPPVISGLPGPSMIECSATPNWVTPTATDNCGTPTLTFADATVAGSCPDAYTITRTWTADDGCGNTATASQEITVDDTTPPVISGLPGPSTIECSATPNFATPTATDNCATPALTFVDATMAGSCPDAYTITRTWTATDDCGNTATAEQVINVDDTTPPVISGLPGPSTVECSGTPTWVTPTATDNCGTPALTFADVTTNGSCPNEYTITRTWTATDDCGNTVTAEQVFTIDDTTPPVISGLPGPSTIECDGTPTFATPTAIDNCSTPTLTFADVTTNGSCPNEYTITRTWTADDGCGNTATATQVINVDDTMPPTISGVPGPSSIECDGTPVWGTPTATDNCSTPALTFVDATVAGSCPGSYTLTRTWTADDGCGNTATAVQTINVDDTTPPVISGLPGPSMIECSATPNWVTPTATDNCGTPTLTFADATVAGSCPDAYTITRTWTADDGCGNTATASQEITVDDTTPPVISGLPGPSTIECSATPNFATPTATDNCATPALTFVDATMAGSCPDAYTITRTWTATDDCGNTATAEQVINVDDTTPPVISGLPGPSTVECSGTPSWVTPTVTDNCGTPTLTFADVTTNGACPNEYTITRTWTADDGCGNTATAAQVFNVDDTTPPVISGLPGPSTIECDGTPNFATPTATDNCGTPSLTFADVTTNGSCPNEYTITRTWTADDGCGNTATASQVINVDDTTPPVISGLPGTTNIECSDTPAWDVPTATDNCSTPTLTFADATVAGPCPGSYTLTRTWTADDGCGNTATAVQTINVDDTTPPVISGLPGPSTIECSATPNWVTPTATDNCGTPTLTFADATVAGSCPDAYTITRTWTADDGCGNTATAFQVINVDDTTPPVIGGLPGPSTVECSGTPTWVTPTVTDNCSTPALTFTDVTVNGSCPNEYSITRTWTATDDCGNTATASQEFSVDDTTPPVISGLPGPSTIECDGTPNWATPTVTDNCGTPTVTFADVTTNGSCPNEYSITRTWTADDGCGNTATASQVINVDDTTPPVISGLPGPSMIECDGTLNFATPTATDNCGTPTLTFADVTTNGSCPNEYTIIRTWTADDGCGNTATASQVINVEDTVPPVISGLAGPTNIECSDTPAWDVPTATDNCGTPTLTFVDATVAGSCPNAYTLTRTWTADDGCGNTATAVQTINVDDTTPPVISGLPGPSTIECDATPNFATPTATDNCGTPTLTFADATVNGSCPNEYTITRTWTADDGCGNTATASQVINVDDTTPPVIGGLPGPSIVECSGTPTWVTPTATDNCSTPALTFTDVTVNGSCPNEYTITRTWTATDDCGNTATASQEFSVDDTTPPVISGLPGPSTIECDGMPNWATPTVTDNCGTPSVTFSDVTTNGSCPNEYTITRTWTADDGCGNTATASQVINVDDTTPPVISGLPGPSTIECDATPNFATPTATDNCGTPTLTFADVTTNGSCPNEFTITRTWTADDGCGNTATASQVINVEDTVPPVISGLAGPTNIECSDTPAWDVPTATDNCGTPTLTFVDATIAGACPNAYTLTRTWTADDGCGNTATAVQTINVDDTTPPVISGLPGPSSIECDATPNFASPTVTDNCGTPTLTFTDATVNGSCPNEYTITRTWTANDGCGNTATASQVINVDDTTPPVIGGLPGPSTVECSGTPTWVTPTATDNCSTPALTFTDVTVNGSCPNEYTITRTWTATDDCGNTATASQEFIVDDTTPPTASDPAAVTVECVGDVPAPDPNVVTDEADNCPGAITVAFVSDMSSGGPCPEIITRTYIITDACGNTTLVTQTITVDDTTLPTASSPAPVSVDCIADVPAPDINVITDEADNCPGGIVVAFVGDVSDGNTCPETITRTYSVTDACGNSILVTQTITVDDDVLPTATGPAPLSVTCIGDVPAPDPNLVTDEADNCPGIITVAFVSDNSDGNNCPETITRTYSVTDACGNSILVTQTITVNDDVPPTASSPAPIILDCVANIPAPDPNVITDEADNCPGAITVAWESDSSDGGVCPETITRTYSITDACGNSVLVTQVITIDDDVPPTASSPASVTVECVGDIPAPDPNVITDEADNCPGALTVAFISDVSGGGPCPEVFTRTYSVTDACGNSILVTQSITVDDTTPPTASSPAPIDVDCIADIPAPDPNIIIDEADNCPGALTVDFVGDVSDGGACPETITRTYSVTDACGNITLVTQTIIVDDDIAPTASNLAPISVPCIGDVPVPDPNLVTDEADNCPGAITVAFVSDNSDGNSCPETITRTYSVTDACGNSILVTQTITVYDDVPPTASSPAPIILDCVANIPAPDPNVITDEADNCSGAITVAWESDSSDGGVCPETITRTYSITDACGNSVLVTQLITIDDDVPPTATSPASVTVECVGDIPAPDPNVITDEADNCPGGLTVAFINDVSGGGPCPEVFTRTYSVTDACGNSILVSQSITVDDTTPPTASSPAPIDVDCVADIPAPDPNIITDEADNCPGALTVDFVGDVSDGGLCPETITRTYSVTDACGNITLINQIITVDDDISPTASNLAPINVTCIGDVPAPDPNLVTDEADNCPGTLTVAFFDDSSDGGSCPETITRSYSVTDACGNQILVTQVITINDDIPPTASNPASVNVECSGSVPVPDPLVVTDEADNCPGAITVAFVSDMSDGGTCPETVIRTYSVTDACGNSILVTQSITVGDIDPPTASNPAPLAVDCIEDVPAPDVNVVTDESDNCGGVLVVAFVNETTDGGLCPETITRNYSVTDECGNSILVTQTITVDDNIPPTATAPAALDVDCFGDVPAPDVNIITDEADNCTAPIVVTHIGDVPDGASCPLTITRTYSITDGCGNQITVDQIISVNDDTPPTATNPSSEILSGCNTPIPAPDISVVTDAADNCGTPVVAFVSDVTDLIGCTETTTRTFSVTDACNNSITVEQLIIRTVDMTPPIFTTPPSDVTVNCIAQVPPMVDLDYTDNCSPAGTVVGTETGPSGNPLTIIREWTVTDECGNTASWMQTITILENNSQVIINEDLCPGETVTINGEVYDMEGVFNDTIPGVNGECDTILVITIDTLGYNNASVSADLCPGETVTINGEIYSTGGTYLDTLTGVGGECDTLLTITISELGYNVASITADLCPGDTVTINGEEYPVAGMYTDTLTGVGGECDTILSIQINQLDYNNSTVNGTICSGQSITIYGETYTMGGIYMDTIQSTTGGCDTAVTIIIAEDDLFTDTINASYCTGSSVFVYGVEYDMAGTYLDTVTSTTGGCDTAVTIFITEQSLIPDTLVYNGCMGDGYSVVINGTVYDEDNPIGDEILPGQGTCDTLLHISLSFALVDPALIDPAGPFCLTGGVETLTATPPGGTWSGAVTSDQFDPAALGVGTYEVIYTISGSCGSADTIDVVVYELTLSCSTLQNESAPGAADGEAQVSVSGGVPPYDITWTGPSNGSVTLPADGSFTITNLPGGVYNVEVEDATGCIAECEFIITSPVPCELMIDGVTIQDASCPGVNNGSIIVDASSNMPPVEYSIDGGAFGSNNVFTMLTPGPHTVTVRDAAGCVVEQIINVGVGQGPELTLLEVVDATCGQANGSIEVDATGGSTPYNYSIDGITYGLSPLFPGLNAGNYNIYLIDDGGCTDTIPVTVTATNAPIINSIDISQSSCGQADGSLTINATGGLGVLMYSINGGTPQPSPVFNGLMAGTYSILVEDEAGCQVTGSATITDEGGPSIDIVDIEATSCGAFDGTITIEASGTPVLQYQLNNDPFQTSNFFDNLPSGNYTITVRDGNGCLVSQVVNVPTTDGPQITNVVVTDTECGLDNGNLLITTSGGTGNLEIFVNGDPYNGEDLPAGDYEIIVEDENGCTAESFATIEPSIGPEFDVYITPAHCGQADGIVELDATEGTPPFQYSFDGGPFGPSFTFVNKTSDFYTVAVRDANGCIVEEDIFLWEEDPPSIEDILTTDPDCGQANGMIVVDADSSGNLMYSIQLPFFQEGPTFTNVAPDTYTVTVRDEWGCEDTGTAVINANPNPILTLDTVSTACGQSIGVITATATGGITPYQYSINNGPFTSNNVFSGLAAGTYTVVVRGNNGCEDTETAVIIAVGTQFGDLITSICEGDTLFLHGEEFTTAGDYMVDVPGGATNGCDSIVNLDLGIDSLNDVIIDQSICAGDTFTYNGIYYTVAGQYVIDTIASTTGGCDTIVTIDLSVEPLLNTYLDVSICDGGVYTINGMDYTVAGNYVIDTIQAGTGCDSIRTLRLAVEDDSETTITAFICEGDTYTINGMDYTMTGIYNVDTIAGPNSCDTILILDLTVNSLPTANSGADMTIDCEVQSVTLNGSASGGNILWTGPDINAGNETDLMPEVTLPGIYVLTVTSSQSCIATDTVVVNLDPEAVIADAGPDAFFSCDIDTIILQASPVGPNYSYQWTGPGINASNENLPNPIVTEPGTYTLVVTDQISQCVSLPDEIFIDDITVVIIAIIQDPLTLNCFTTSVDLVSTGSSIGPDIVYTWFDEEGNLISTSPGFPVSSGGMFTLIVEDTISGCFDDDSVMVQDLTEYPAVDAGPDQVIDCNHPTVILNDGAVNTNPDLVFEWTGPAGGIIGPIDEITAVAGLAGDYILTAIDINNGCENDDTVTVTNLTSLPLADINIAQTITCIDSIALLNIGGSTTGQDVTYTWSGPGINNIVADSIETELPGTYFLDVVVESTGCAARDTAILVLPDEPSDLMAVAEIPICEGDTSGSLTINNVSGGTPVYMYALDGGPFQTSPVFDNLMAGQYDIAVVDANGCQYTETFTIADGIPLTIDIGPDIELELGDSVILWADVSLPWSQIDSIVWTPLDILSCEYCTNPTLYGLNDAVVTATVYTGGCIDQDMLNLRVDVDANIYIPNVFSPNGDGINDHVTVFTDHRVRRVVYLEIFDRWGNQVFVGEDFEPNDPLLGWDGRFKGKLMNPAVFAYIARVELINGDLIDRKGDITIVR